MSEPLIDPERIARVEIKKAAVVVDDPTVMRLPAATLLRWKHDATPLRLATKPSRLVPQPKIVRERNAPGMTAPIGTARAAKRPQLHGIAGHERTLLRQRSQLRRVRIDLVDVGNGASNQPAKIARPVRVGKNGL